MTAHPHENTKKGGRETNVGSLALSYNPTCENILMNIVSDAVNT